MKYKLGWKVPNYNIAHAVASKSVKEATDIIYNEKNKSLLWGFAMGMLNGIIITLTIVGVFY